MNISVGNSFPTSRTSSSSRTVKASSDFPATFSSDFSITGNKPTWTAKNWDIFMEDLIKNFDDEEFAARLKAGSDEEISTEKKVNWQATGEDELTQDQIDYLKATYDIENMSGQDYYNLIADLTNMNVISGRDTVKQHAGVMPIGVNVQSDRSRGEMADGNGEVFIFSGNIFGNFLNRSQDFSYTLGLLNDSQPFGSGREYLDFKGYFEDQSGIYDKMMSILNQLVR